MNKKKIGALVGVIGLTGAIALAQFYNLDHILASYISQDFKKKEARVSLSEKGDPSETWSNLNSSEEDFRLPLFQRAQKSAESQPEDGSAANGKYSFDPEITLEKELADQNQKMNDDDELIVDGKPIFSASGEGSSDPSKNDGADKGEEVTPVRLEDLETGMKVSPEEASKAEPTSGTKAEEKAESKSEPSAEAKTEAKPAPQADAKSELKSEPLTEAKSESKSEPSSEAKADPKAEPESKPQAEANPEPKADPPADSPKDKKNSGEEETSQATQAKTEKANTEAKTEEGKEKDLLKDALLNKDPKAEFTGKVILPVVNIRTAPSLDSDYAGALKEGDMVRGSLKDGWLEMSFDGQACYVSGKCIEPLEADQIKELEKKELENKLEEISKEAKEAQKKEDARKEKSTPKPYHGYVQFKEASIVDGPSDDAKLIDNIKLNTLVKGEIRDGWVKFTYQGKEAYISENFVGKAMVQVEKPKPAPKPQPQTGKKNSKTTFNQAVNTTMSRFLQFQSSAPLGPGQGSGAIWPIAGYHSISYGIGPRWNSYHNGIDAPCPVGTPVKAIKGGTIIHASWYGGYGGGGGNTIIVRQDDGYECKYMHLSAIQARVGQKVAGGSQIGLSGNTGFSTGPHLHIELTRGGRVLDARTVYGI